MRARDCDLGTNIAQFSRFQENFHEENWSISHCKLNTDCLPLVEQQKRKQAQQTGCYVDKYSEDSLFCLERIKFCCSRSLVRHEWASSIRHRWKQTIELRSVHAIRFLVNGSGGSIKLLGKISDSFLLGLPWRIGCTSCTISRFPCRRR